KLSRDRLPSARSERHDGELARNFGTRPGIDYGLGAAPALRPDQTNREFFRPIEGVANGDAHLHRVAFRDMGSVGPDPSAPAVDIEMHLVRANGRGGLVQPGVRV